MTNKINESNLENIAGGNELGDNRRVVSGIQTGYLALRTEANDNDSNIIGQLNNGDIVNIIEYGSITGPDGNPYLPVYSPKHGREGYVNARFLTVL